MGLGLGRVAATQARLGRLGRALGHSWVMSVSPTGVPWALRQGRRRTPEKNAADEALLDDGGNAQGIRGATRKSKRQRTNAPPAPSRARLPPPPPQPLPAAPSSTALAVRLPQAEGSQLATVSDAAGISSDDELMMNSSDEQDGFEAIARAITSATYASTDAMMAAIQDRKDQRRDAAAEQDKRRAHEAAERDKQRAHEATMLDKQLAQEAAERAEERTREATEHAEERAHKATERAEERAHMFRLVQQMVAARDGERP